ncbi:hypothetical protein PSEWESI4_00880 [Pseudomonas carbonaria]|uniref:Uncharacterized protein n=2 Tax=Zestomonas carbonaria TaxID=2762745 RepID=A0A7U7I7W4_9GAMM|nr:hypothetical protein PSEWESI4_00880 [Pseudomonas carbonaria]
MDNATQSTRRKSTLLIWGGLDALHILWYCTSSWLHGRTPYIQDLISTHELLLRHGSFSSAVIVASWLLQLSLIMSCLMFLLDVRYAKYLGYAQIPFRLFFLVPSISLILVAAHFVPGHNLIFLALVAISETVKIWSLRRYA